ncbi:inositol 2-dehydrogenase [Enterobacter cloacae complex sp. 2024EL-00215]|uniref:inositol 2-dehydrogenase n=1 Tax=unclassified Enterobacter cloacae complex TaxID=2757714 RepID=UPI003751137D
MPEKIKICVFGAGRMGERHIANVAANNRAELAWIVDPDFARASKLTEKYGGRVADTPEHALSDPNLDAVIIASATHTHVDLIIAAAKAGKAILCEKPIDLDMSRVELCAKEIEGCKVPIMIGFQRRFDATLRAVSEAVARGEVGNVEVITIISRDPSPPPAEYIAVSGGQFHDQMIHDFDLALWFSGAKGRIEVFAMGSNLVDPAIGALGDSDTAQVTLRFSNGAFCRIDCSRRAVYGYDQRVEVFGSQGMVCSANQRRTALERYSAHTTAAGDVLNPGFMERYWPTYAVELEAFLDAIASGQSSAPDFKAGKRALMLADAARESARSGQVVVIDIDK